MLNAYDLAGVNVSIEAQASRIMFEASKLTFANRIGNIGEIIQPFDDFAGLKMINIGGLPIGSFMSLGFDTTGSKVEFAWITGIHDTIAHCLFAMVCDDALVRGGEPILVGTNLDIRSLGNDEKYFPIIRSLARGFVAAAKKGNVAVINGEIAQMTHLMPLYVEFPFLWGAACVWVARKHLLFTGLEIRVGDAVVAVREKTLRANGASLIRKNFEKAYGSAWHGVPFSGTTLGLKSLEPSTIYSRTGVKLHGGFYTEGTCKIHGMVHVTGGGIPEKLRRVLTRSGFGARLHNLYEPGEIIAHALQVGGQSDREGYDSLNMGQGLLVITPEPDAVIAGFVEDGHEAVNAGEITREPEIVITSKGGAQYGDKLTF